MSATALRADGAARFSRRPWSKTSSDAVPLHASARWVSALFLCFVLLQRFSVPGMTNVSLLLPLVFVWGALGLWRGVLAFDPVRSALWIIAAGATALVAVLQLWLDASPIVSVTSWGLLLTQFLPGALRFTDRSREAFVQGMRGIARICTWLASLSVVFMASQAVTPYQDLMAKYLPSSVLLTGFNTSYPLTYGATLYKSNAWICLEASFLSYIMAVGLLAAVVSGARTWRVLWLLVGLFTSASGSGFAILAVAVVVLVVLRERSQLLRLGLPLAGVVLAALATPFGWKVLGRVGELSNNRSSGSVRTLEPYIAMWPQWMSDPWAILLGRGAGSSQRLVIATAIPGLLDSTLLKIFFDYGLLAGAVLFFFVWTLYTRSPSPMIAVAVGASMWALQTANVPFVVCVYCVITLWAPRPDPADPAGGPDLTGATFSATG